MADLVTPRFAYPPEFTGDVESYANRLNQYLFEVFRTYNSLLDRGLRWQNLRSQLISTTFGTANSLNTLTHNLGKVPEFYVWNLETEAAPGPQLVYHLLTDTSGWNKTTIGLRCTMADVNATLLVM